MSPAAILEEIDDEDERSRTANLLQRDSGAGEPGTEDGCRLSAGLAEEKRKTRLKCWQEQMRTQTGERKAQHTDENTEISFGNQDWEKGMIVSGIK